MKRNRRSAHIAERERERCTRLRLTRPSRVRSRSARVQFNRTGGRSGSSASTRRREEKCDDGDDLKYLRFGDGRVHKDDVGGRFREDVEGDEDRREEVASGREFLRRWRSYDSSTTSKDAYKFLISLKRDAHRTIFGFDFDAPLVLGSLVSRLEAGFRVEHAAIVVSILSHLSKTKSFYMALAFFNPEEHDAKKRLFCSLAKAASTADTSIDRRAVERLEWAFKR